MLSFFLLEKLVLWRHCHTGHDCEVHTSSAASLVIIGDAFHTFVDGALIAAAVLTSIPLGATTALAVAAHEIPQEVGDFAILLRAGYSRSRAFTLNLLSATGGVLGALAMLAGLADGSRRCFPTSSASPPAAFSMWRWRISFRTCTAAASKAGRPSNCCSSAPAS